MHFHLLLFLLMAALLKGTLSQEGIAPVAATNNGDITTPGPCPGSLPDFPDFEFPHLIIPVSSSDPDTPYPNTLTPCVTAGDISVIFNFDIPGFRRGQMCNIKFFFPAQNQLTTSSFVLRGFGTYTFSLSALGAGAVDGSTTWNSQPLQDNPHGFPRAISMQPGHAYDIGNTICVPGRISITMSSTDSSLMWFQDWNPCPIGLFIVYSP